MPKVYWVQCPDCQRKYYISVSLLGKGLDLMCPFCKRYFKQEESLLEKKKA